MFLESQVGQERQVYRPNDVPWSMSLLSQFPCLYPYATGHKSHQCKSKDLVPPNSLLFHQLGHTEANYTNAVRKKSDHVPFHELQAHIYNKCRKLHLSSTPSWGVKYIQLYSLSVVFRPMVRTAWYTFDNHSTSIQWLRLNLIAFEPFSRSLILFFVLWSISKFLDQGLKSWGTFTSRYLLNIGLQVPSLVLSQLVKHNYILEWQRED